MIRSIFFYFYFPAKSLNNIESRRKRAEIAGNKSTQTGAGDKCGSHWPVPTMGGGCVADQPQRVICKPGRILSATTANAIRHSEFVIQIQICRGIF
jgi:hypothetical protein